MMICANSLCASATIPSASHFHFVQHSPILLRSGLADLESPYRVDAMRRWMYGFASWAQVSDKVPLRRLDSFIIRRFQSLDYRIYRITPSRAFSPIEWLGRVKREAYRRWGLAGLCRNEV